ncbi:PP2C family protein-serine/threonine phosphatase [Streptomyces sp. 6N223]|uniref:PP2C family protein-serine/threonine phosphatase n=1 Tax=Streptomyces sp. 6N223 TaxID=3457412 RepID=UPI003FD6AB80
MVARAVGIVGAGQPGLLPRWLRALPWVLFAVLAVLEPIAARVELVGTLIAAVPPLAGLIYGPRQTALLAAGVVAVLATPQTRAEHISGGDLAAVVAIAAFSVLVAWVRSRYTSDLVVVRSVAEAAQRAVLPPLPPAVGPVRCAALYRPALRAALVGGDLYDVREGPYGVRAVIGDVRGHGLAAVGTVAALLGSFREAVLYEPELGGVAARLNRRLRVDVATAGEEADAELFATALLLEVALDAGEVHVVSLGHPSALLIRGGVVRELAAEPGPPLGVAPEVVPPPVASEPLRPGDVLLGYTDGVTEARDRHGAFYPLGERLEALLVEGTPTPGWLVDAVWRDLSAYAPTIRDDVALLSLRLG